jgi:3-hydroxyisobutyrate dehydrogenase-like beta-hydroxyacid dehydrogenase
MSEFSKLGFIGVGTMGGPMCLNLAKGSGLETIAFDLDPKRLEAQRQGGVAVADSIAEVVQASDIVFMCLPGEPQVRDVGWGSGGLLDSVRPGQVVVDMTTATVHVNRELGAALAERDVAFADAPVARGVPSAKDGTLSIMVGCSEELFRRIEPLLLHMGTDISHCGDIGTGQVLKLMNNMMIFQTVSALAEALAIGTRAGVPGPKLFEILSKGSADSFALRRHGSWMAKGVYPDDQFPTTYSQKDLGYAIALAEEMGVDAKGAKLVAKRFEEAIDKGLGKYYSPVIYKLFEDD